MNTHPKRFERMTARLLDQEPGVIEADLFGVDGAPQYGIDVVATLEAGGIDVASCKCYPRITPGEIRNWSDDFLDHWTGRWRAKGVGRFILVTAALNATAEAILDQVEAEKARFKALGMTYEHWHPERLVKRLRKDRSLTHWCLGAYWAAILCGEAPSEPVTMPPAQAWSRAADVEQLSGLQGLLSQQTDQRIEAALGELRRGKTALADTLVLELRGEPLWSQLQRPAQARVMRLAGSLALRRKDTAEAESLADQADALSLGDPLLRAQITLNKEGPVAAFAALGTPTSRAGRQWLAALHLQHGSLTEAATLIDALAFEAEDDPETLRLLAFLRLTQNRRDEALLVADRAEAIAPDWPDVMRVSAIVRYAAALSPCVRPPWLFFPNPLDEDLIREDDVSQGRLREALSRFDRLIGTDGDDDDRAWRLACLSNLVDRTSEAEAYCNTLLQQDRADVAAIAWSFARGYQIDAELSRNALAAQYRNGTASAEQIRGYGWLLAKESGPIAAAETLLEHVEHQTGRAADEARARIAAMGQQPSVLIAEEIGEEDGDWSPPLDLTAKVDSAKATGDWAAVIEIYAEALAVEPPHPLALLIGQTLATHAQWAPLGRNVEGLMRFATAGAARLAAHAVANTQTPQVLLDFLAEIRSFFPGGRPPPELRRMEIEAQADVGNLPTAVTAAQELAEQTRQPLDRINLAQLRLAAGDTRQAAPLVRDALETGGLSPETALRLSAAFEQEDLPLAQSLVRHAITGGVDEGLLTTVMMQAFRVGLENEAAVLFPQIDARARAGAYDVRIFDLDGALGVMREAAKTRDEALKFLKDGAIPIHVLKGALGADLALIYDLQRPLIPGQPLAAIFVRHGARPIEFAPPLAWSDWQVHLDLTGALLADQLDLLGELEQLPAPIRISRCLPEALYALARDATPAQPRRIEAMRKIVQARAAGRVHVVDKGETNDSLIVRHERKRSEAGAPGPTIHSLADALHHLGDIEDAAHAGLLAELGRRADDDVGLMPAPSGRLHFIDNTLETFAAGGQLEAALLRYRCEIEQSDFDRLVLEIDAADSGVRRGQRLADLRQRIAAGILQGRYILLDEIDPESPAAARESPVERCLFDLIVAPSQYGGVIWCDDRMVSGFTNANGNVVVGSVEVLNALVQSGHLSNEARRSKLQLLRRAGAMFIPIEADEVLIPLRNARVHDGALIESPALATIRRYVSAALSRDDAVRVGPTTHGAIEGQPDEAVFLLRLRRLPGDLIQAIWRDSATDIATCRARSDWVWKNLRVAQMLRPLPQGANEALAALSLASLLANVGLFRGVTHEETKARWRAYVDWVNDAVISHLISGAATESFGAVKDNLVRFLTAGLAEARRADDRMALDYVLQSARIRTTLQPEPFRQALIDDRRFAGRVGLVTKGHIQLAGMKFDHERFWIAAERALKYGFAKLRDVDGRRARMRRADGGLQLSGRRKARFRHDLLDACALIGAEREAYLKRVCGSLDLRPEVEPAVLESLTEATTVSNLVRAYEDAKTASVIHHYNDASEALSMPRDMDIARLRPKSVADMRHHLRLKLAQPTRDWRQVWDALEKRIGGRWAFRRLAGLPVDLATVIAERPNARGDLAELAEDALTPMAILHVAVIARRCGDATLATDAFAAFLECVEAYGALHEALLHWTEGCFQGDPAWSTLEAHDRLALVWTHADRLLNLLIQHRVDPQAGARFFATNPQPRSLGWQVVRDPTYQFDGAAPDLFTAETLLFYGAAYFADGVSVESVIAPETLERLRARLTKDGSAGAMPRVAVRSSLTPDALVSLFATAPIGLVDAALERQTARLNDALATLGAEPENEEAWMRIASVGRLGVTDDQRRKIDEIFTRVDLMAAVDHAEKHPSGRVILDVRRWQGGPIDDRDLLDRLAGFARSCAARHGGALSPTDTEAMKHFNATVEIAAFYARAPSPAEGLARLARAALVIVNAWPSTVEQMRNLFDLVCRQLPPPSGDDVWRTFIDLRSRT